MKVGHTYVLPLDAPVEGRYELAQCAHSGLELINGDLYTFEQRGIGVDRRLQFYASYVTFRTNYPRAVESSAANNRSRGP